jgi:predicted RNase H-like HicB family nuclease
VKAYTVVLSPDLNRPFNVVCPAMPGAIVEGDTREGALRAMAEVMVTWLELARARDEGPLEETPALIAATVAEVLEDRDAEGWERSLETTVMRPAVATTA